MHVLFHRRRASLVIDYKTNHVNYFSNIFCCITVAIAVESIAFLLLSMLAN